MLVEELKELARSIQEQRAEEQKNRSKSCTYRLPEETV